MKNTVSKYGLKSVVVGMAGLQESRLPTNASIRGLPGPTEVVLTVGVVTRLSAAWVENQKL